ncbi:hypothetical protein BH09PSE5_BH09PSE5_39780 [soil metagenome]
MAMDTVTTLAADATELADVFLSPPERLRLASLPDVRRQAQFRAGRLLMRRLLAHVHGGDPLTDWPLSAAVDAPPAFLGEAFAQVVSLQWHLSISHAGGYVACAVSASPVGIDIEAPRPGRDVLALAESLCNATEVALLRALPLDERESCFLQLWTLKEATLKRGSGRQDGAALRRLALREIGVEGLANGAAVSAASAGATKKDGTSASPGLPSDRLQVRSGAWTWQGRELTLAVVAEAASAEPLWALPPPAFILRNARAWTVDTANAGRRP